MCGIVGYVGKKGAEPFLIEGLRRLVSGDSVGAVALDLGYNSASAFIAMFRREFGTTPRKYLEG